MTITFKEFLAKCDDIAPELKEEILKKSESETDDDED